jgi:hypothetical protein
MSNKYTELEEEIIRNNYEKYGAKYCAKLLNRDEYAVQMKAKRMNIKKKGREKHSSMQKINPEQFWNIKTKEIAYFLGFLWADGYINYRQNKTSNCYKIAIEIKSQDMNQLSIIFNSLGEWAFSKRKRKEHWQETTTMSTNSQDIYMFLKSVGYDTKSNTEPALILQKIPENLKVYWWRGYFDGDGSISIGEYPARWKSLQFSSTFDYKWSELRKLLDELSIKKYNIQNYIHKTKKHKSSKFIIQNKTEIIKFINFLSKSEIGLERKTERMNAFLTRYNTNTE